ncbi:MAG TPA: glycine betaine/L-proline ABC transporter ATP-binding protein [bacterium]|nr:glycine betaine/L-proline ABC transporter ATP-binding protein [bacterium]
MPKIRVESLYKIFGQNPDRAMPLIEQGKTKEEVLEATGCTMAVTDNSFNVERGETFVVMGLSGSGKSTLLRCLNRLIEPTSGTVYIDDIDVTAANEEELREIRRSKTSMVFQHFGLLPHRSVSENVSFGLEIQGVERDARKKSAYEAIEQVGLKGYEEMMTRELSGGMQQRVGLARALATNPEILLMDEAFSALDPLIRNEMQDELLELQSEVQKTIVFITHDLDEALKLGDRIAIMKDGWIVQVGTSEEILTRPANDYVESFVENVDRSKVITAQAVMFEHPERVVSTRDGPGVAIRRMRKLGVDSLPVTDAENQFRGIIHIDEAVKLQRADKHSLKASLVTDVPTTSPDTPVVELLPLVWDSRVPIAVLDEKGRLQGVVARASVVAEIMGTTRQEMSTSDDEQNSEEEEVHDDRS